MLKSKSVSCNNERMLTNKTTKIKSEQTGYLCFLIVLIVIQMLTQREGTTGEELMTRAWPDWLCVSALVKQMGEYVCNDRII